MKVFSIILDKIEQVMIIIASITLAIMTMYIFLDVIGRYIFNHPIVGALEITEDYLMGIVIFFAISYTFTRNGHVSVQLFDRFMSVHVKKIILKLVHLIGLVYMFLITWQGYKQMVYTYSSGSLSKSSLAYILRPAYLILVLGSALLCIRIFQALIGGKKESDKTDIAEVA
jgi:TRAP-type transport system small permease protein